MTRTQIEADYRVFEGTIHSAGKFEGEPVYVPYFFEHAMNGMSDEEHEDEHTGDWSDTFVVTEEDRAEFPELERVAKVTLHYSDNGFVTSSETERDRSFEHALKRYTAKL